MLENRVKLLRLGFMMGSTVKVRVYVRVTIVQARVYNRVKASLGQCLSLGTLVDLKVGIHWTV